MKQLIMMLLFSSQLSYAGYLKPELLALSFSTRNYNLDQDTYCHLGTPMIFEGKTLINCQKDGNHELVLWDENGQMSVLHSTKNFLSVPRFLDKTLTWYEYDIEGVTKVYQWKDKELTELPIDTHVTAVTYLGSKWIYQSKESIRVFDQGVFQAANIDNISYVFSPSVSTKGEFAVKIRRETLANSGPDEIWSYKDGEWIKVFADRDSNPQSPWLSFNNSVTVGDGKVYVIAKDGSGEAIVEISNKGERVIVREGRDVKQFESFNIAYNNGSLVFRAIDHQNRKVIHVYDDKGLHRILTQGDTVHTPFGVTGEVDYPNEHSIIYNNPGIGENGEVVIQATLKDYDDKKTLLGIGVISIKKDQLD